MVSYLCELAAVKRKSYYAWLKAEPKRINRERKDEQDFILIKQVYDEKNGKSGGRDIRMVLENDYFTVMNLKKIYRIMKKFNLKSKIRRSNPYKRMAQATQEHRTCSNILNRNFAQNEPGVFCKERIHSIAIATTQCCNLTWSLCGHESQAKKPARSRAGFATKGYHAHHSM